MGLAFFAIAAWNTGYAQWDEALHQMVSGVNADILLLFVPLLVLTFWLHKVNRWAYVVSGFLFLPLMALNLKPFLMTYGFGFTYVLAASRRPFWLSSLPSSTSSASKNPRISTFTCGNSCGSSLPHRCAAR